MATNTGTAVGYSYNNITTQTTTVVKTGTGILKRIVFNGPTATGVITLYDNTSADGTKIGTITTPATPQPQELDFDVAFTNGLTVVTATANQDLTICYI